MHAASCYTFAYQYIICLQLSHFIVELETKQSTFIIQLDVFTADKIKLSL